MSSYGDWPTLSITVRSRSGDSVSGGYASSDVRVKADLVLSRDRILRTFSGPAPVQTYHNLPPDEV